MGVVEVNNQIIISRGVQKEAEPDLGFQQQTPDWAADVVPVCGCYLETLNHIVHLVASPALPRPPLAWFVNREAEYTASLFSIIITDRP